eukprot:scaffold193485_cov32-Tisochrysis_lutea.AAC.9
MWTLWVVGKSMSLSRAARAHGLPVSHLGYQKSRAGAAPAAATSLQIAQGRLPKDTDCTGCQWHAPGQLAEHLLKPVDVAVVHHPSAFGQSTNQADELTLLLALDRAVHVVGRALEVVAAHERLVAHDMFKRGGPALGHAVEDDSAHCVGMCQRAARADGVGQRQQLTHPPWRTQPALARGGRTGRVPQALPIRAARLASCSLSVPVPSPAPAQQGHPPHRSETTSSAAPPPPTLATPGGVHQIKLL